MINNMETFASLPSGNLNIQKKPSNIVGKLVIPHLSEEHVLSCRPTHRKRRCDFPPEIAFLKYNRMKSQSKIYFYIFASH